MMHLQNWNGNVADGIQRPPIQFFCADGTPCTNMILNNVNMWSLTDSATNKCQSAYGSGGSCLRSRSGGSYAATTTTINKPAGYTSPPTLSGDLSQGFATNSPIPIPCVFTVVLMICFICLSYGIFYMNMQDDSINVLPGPAPNLPTCEEQRQRIRSFRPTQHGDANDEL